ncbi:MULTISPECIES: phage GP46 family protein [Dickeya]|uniref:Phage GP46 family protein n=1 Tax=Dickeya oryzae TaxID=1240404 RepID=A0AB39IGC1_9GAMM|nr:MULTISPECIES: phage GP46 family protein [Dickeya]MCA6993535.1 phage GP46 family protein [Dickeya oryzae]
MDNLLNPTTGDYTGTATATLANAVYIRLMTPLGSWWAVPSLGSKLHLLTREKNVSRVYTLARQYAVEALQPLIDDGRATTIEVATDAGDNGWLILIIDVTAPVGRELFKYPVRVS